MADQVELNSPPLDSISSLQFSPNNSSHLLVGAWDSTTRLYDVDANEQKCKFDHRAPILAVSFGDGTHGYSGGLDQAVRQFDFETERARVVGNHANAVSTMTWAKDQNALVTGSWDQTIRLWDARSATPLQHTSKLPERIYHASAVGSTLVVALASRLFHIYDLRNLSAGPRHERESSLKFMTRSLACMPNGEGYATGSVEGRIAVEYFDEKAQDRKYAFKCHRAAVGEVDHVWPVTALAFHPTYNTFASAGSDGTVSIWDHTLKKRLRQYPKYAAGVPAIAFAPNGQRLAVGVSYTWEDGEAGAKTAPTPSLWVRNLGDEVKPKGWTG